MKKKYKLKFKNECHGEIEFVVTHNLKNEDWSYAFMPTGPGPHKPDFPFAKIFHDYKWNIIKLVKKLRMNPINQIIFDNFDWIEMGRS